MDVILPCDGETYDHQRDGKRLHSQRNRIVALMRDGEWRSLHQIATATGDPEASVSARLRDLRKAKSAATSSSAGTWRSASGSTA